MQYIPPCNSALIAQETRFLTQKCTFLAKDLQKVRKSWRILIRDKSIIVNSAQAEYCPTFHFPSVRAQTWHIIFSMYLGIFYTNDKRTHQTRNIRKIIHPGYLRIQDHSTSGHNVKRPICLLDFCTVHPHYHPDHPKHPNHTDQTDHSTELPSR